MARYYIGPGDRVLAGRAAVLTGRAAGSASNDINSSDNSSSTMGSGGGGSGGGAREADHPPTAAYVRGAHVQPNAMSPRRSALILPHLRQRTWCGSSGSDGAVSGPK